MRIKQTLALMLIVLTTTFVTGCATILSGSTQKITIQSTPPGAHVKFGYQSGFTPITFEVPKGQDYPVIISRGSQQQIIMLERKLDPNTFLNLIPPLWPGFVVDAVTGAITKYDPDIVRVNFPTATTVSYKESNN